MRKMDSDESDSTFLLSRCSYGFDLVALHHVSGKHESKKAQYFALMECLLVDSMENNMLLTEQELVLQ